MPHDNATASILPRARMALAISVQAVLAPALVHEGPSEQELEAMVMELTDSTIAIVRHAELGSGLTHECSHTHSSVH